MLKEFFDGKKLQKRINPDEVIAYGAAIQAFILVNNTFEKIEKIEKNIKINVVPLSIGIETIDGIMNVLIPRNSPILFLKSKIFSTYYFNQSSVLINIFEGERLLVKDNHLLSEFILDEIENNTKLKPKIKITLYINENLIINYNKERLSKDEIENHFKKS